MIGRVCNVGNETGEVLTPISDLFTHEYILGVGRRTFRDATRQIINHLDQLKIPGFNAVHAHNLLQSSESFAAKVLKSRESILGEDWKALDDNQISAIFLYTCESEFYIYINQVLRARNRREIEPYKALIMLILLGLQNIPHHSGSKVYRGVAMNLSHLYNPGTIFVWSQFSSCTTSKHVATAFMGSSGPRTLFEIELTTGNARMIQKLSLIPSEEEVLLPMNSRFEVTNRVIMTDGMVVIHLKELPNLDLVVDLNPKITFVPPPPGSKILIDVRSYKIPPPPTQVACYKTSS